MVNYDGKRFTWYKINCEAEFEEKKWGNLYRYIEEEQTIHKEKVQKDKQRSTKHTHKTKDRVTRTSLKTGCEIRCSRRVISSCSTSDCRQLHNRWCHECGKDRKVFMESGTYTWSFVTKIFHKGQPSHCDISTGSISVESPWRF